MILIKFFYFLKGYVIIKAYGKSVWRLVSSCAERGIKLYNITSGEEVRFTIVTECFYDLYKLADDLDVKLKIEKESGFYSMLRRYKKRICFPVGVTIFFLFFAVSSLFLWDIRVETDGNLTEKEVLAKLEEIGVKPGALLKDLPDGRSMKNHLTESFPNVPWGWVYIKGMRATVRIHEGIIPPVVVDVDESCDIIAAKDGFITEMSVKEGKEVVLPGNAVSAGELLISGIVEIGKNEVVGSYEVHADGEVMALTRYEESGKYMLFENRNEFTGREKKTYDIKFFSKNLSLFKKPGYDNSITVEKDIISTKKFSVKQYKHMEADVTKVQLPREWVVEFAKRDLSARVAEKLGASSKLIEEEYIVSDGKDCVTVTGIYSFKEDIGVTVPR